MVLSLKREEWDVVDEKQTELFTIEDSETGFMVQVTDYGATLVRVMVPDKEGKVADVNFGQDSASAFKEEGMFLGAMVGRVANRIENAKFELDGKEYSLFVNNAGLHSLHGGEVGFTYKMWQVKEINAMDDKVEINFEYVSVDGEEGYPGTLTTSIKYLINRDPMQVGWEFLATTDKKTIINLTNHAYWNLESLDALVDDHQLTLNANKYMPGDENNLVTGEVSSVEGTGIDFNEGKKLKDAFDSFGDIDNNFFINDYDSNNPNKLNFVAELYSSKTGRKMKVETTEPCVQVYTGNFMSGNKSFGKECKKHSAICLETQKVPNAINLPDFRDQFILDKDSKYQHKTLHTFYF